MRLAPAGPPAEPTIGTEDLAAGFGGLEQPVVVTVGEYRQFGDDLANAGEFVIGHGAVDGGNSNHHIDKRSVMIQRLGHGSANSPN
jgi:hypothetical protein